MNINQKKIIDLIEELEEMVETGNTLPFSSKALISPEDALDIIDELKRELPAEIDQAQKIVNDKERILKEANEEADKIREKAQQQVNSMINESEITHLATKEAESIVENAQNSAKEIRVGTQQYATNILENLLNTINSLAEKVDLNKKEIEKIR